MPLIDTLRNDCRSEWASYIGHPFVCALAQGTLPEACFRHYLAQDYLFLIHFARAYGLAAYKAETLADIRAAGASLAAIVEREMQLHVTYSAGWSLDEAEMARTPEADATLAYTRFVLEAGLAGDLLDLLVALAPCVIGYADIGRQLLNEPACAPAQNPYGAWIETYGADDYQQVAAAHAAWMEELAARRGADARLPGLRRLFRQATRLETAFWEMGLNPPS